jgi:predicted DNA-binding protein (UPF0251 family)
MKDLQITRLELSELEALRLCDLEGLSQEDAGARMKVSRGTIQRLTKRGRAKLIAALLASKAVIIEKGSNDEDLHPDDRQ